MVDLTPIFGPEGFSIFEFTKDTAKKKYVESQKNLLKMLLNAVENADFKHKKEEEFLETALQNMLKGMSGDKAFFQEGNTSGKRNLSFEKIQKEFDIAKYVFSFRYPVKLKTLEESYKAAATQFNISSATAKKLYFRHKVFIEDQVVIQKNQ